MAHGQGPKGGTWATVGNTVWDHVPPPPPPLGLASYSTQQLMDAQGALGVGGWNLYGPGWT